jgi:hypothetical protein
MYTKVRFTSKRNGATAGLVVEHIDDKSINDLSRLYPYSEASKMEKIERSPEFPTFLEAFNYKFES